MLLPACAAPAASAAPDNRPAAKAARPVTRQAAAPDKRLAGRGVVPPRARAFLVCIDPGHPSETAPGAVVNGLSERKLAWQVALKLRDRLTEMGIASFLTKEKENQKVTNRARAEAANRRQASLLIRLHCDVGTGRGFTWYYPDRAGRKEGVIGPPAAIRARSRELATVLNDAMRPLLAGKLASNPVRTDAQTFIGGKQGGVLTGSIFSTVPTVLLEMCFLNQPADAAFIASPTGQDLLADAIAQGIRAYRNR